jgi:hypothetical protein
MNSATHCLPDLKLKVVTRELHSTRPQPNGRPDLLNARGESAERKWHTGVLP